MIENADKIPTGLTIDIFQKILPPTPRMPLEIDMRFFAASKEKLRSPMGTNNHNHNSQFELMYCMRFYGANFFVWNIDNI